MAASGFGADLITSIGWTWSATAQNIATLGTLKVYVQGTTNTTYQKGTTFSTAGMTKIIDGTITLPSTTPPFSIDVPTGGAGTSARAPNKYKRRCARLFDDRVEDLMTTRMTSKTVIFAHPFVVNEVDGRCRAFDVEKNSFNHFYGRGCREEF